MRRTIKLANLKAPRQAMAQAAKVTAGRATLAPYVASRQGSAQGTPATAGARGAGPRSKIPGAPHTAGTSPTGGLPDLVALTLGGQDLRASPDASHISHASGVSDRSINSKRKSGVGAWMP